MIPLIITLDGEACPSDEDWHGKLWPDGAGLMGGYVHADNFRSAPDTGVGSPYGTWHRFCGWNREYMWRYELWPEWNE